MTADQLALIPAERRPDPVYVRGKCLCGNTWTSGPWYEVHPVYQGGSWGRRISFCGKDACAVRAVEMLREAAE